MRDRLIERILLLAAISAVSMLALITIFIFREGLPVLVDYGPLAFITGTTWAPSQGEFGVLPMIAGSVCLLYTSPSPRD